MNISSAEARVAKETGSMNALAMPPLSGPVHFDDIIPARAPWDRIVRKGQTLRIIDLEGNQAVDFLMYRLDDDAERYSAQDTMAAQDNIYLRAGSVLLSNEGNPMARVTATAVAYHDTIGGACSCESNTLRYGFHTKAQHACVENFLFANSHHGLGKRDIVSNINWFMNVPVEADGALGIVDGISAPGLFVDLQAEMDIVAVISNCPQINNPCNAFNPTPVRVVIAGAGE
jgi:urea carboxylase-associated protein 1